jgi:hypothetical protein
MAGFIAIVSAGVKSRVMMYRDSMASFPAMDSTEHRIHMEGSPM